MAVFFGVALMILATALATVGRDWSVGFHPDELAIKNWIRLVRDDGYLSNRAYPTGWFELFRIRTAIAKRIGKVSEKWQRHSVQDGKVVTTCPPSFSRPPELDAGKHSPTIRDGREFNTWLYVLTALFLYAACLEAGFHPLAAFVSGSFFVASGAPLEFIHYCETDAALLVSMAFFAWLAARTLRKRRAWLVVATAFAAGFAVSCKFTLFPLLLWCFAGPAAGLERAGGETRARWAAKVAALILLAAAAACAGYVAGTPALRMAPDWYLQALRKASRATYGEITRNLGGVYSWRGATVLRFRSLLRVFAEMGAAPLLWGVFSWTFWFLRPYRRQLAGLPSLLPVFVPFLVLACPFVRRQEALPFAVFFAMGAGLPLQWLVFARGTRSRLRRTGRIAAAFASVLAVAALWEQGAKALGTASCFAMRDTRAEAQNWLRGSLPAGEVLFLDGYAEQIACGVECDGDFYSGLPFIWDGTLPEKKGRVARYYVENVGFEGRKPIRDLKTGAVFPDVRRRMEAYRADVLPLHEWAVSPWTPVPTFGQPALRLVALERAGDDAFDVPIGYDSPIFVLADGFRLYDASGPAGVGPRRAVHTVGKRTGIHVNLAHGARWLVTRMLDGADGVRVEREGLFKPKKSELPAGGAVAASLAPSPWERVSARTAAYSTMRCRMRGDDQNIVCASFLAATPAEAARELRLSGNPDGALALLRTAGTLDATAQIEAFLAATDARLAPEEAWVEVARAALDSADRLASERDVLGRTDATLCGIPLGVACDFARLRTGPRMLVPGDRLPVWLPPGRYGVSVACRRVPGKAFPASLFAGQAADFAVASADGDDVVLQASLDLPKGQMLRLLGDSGSEIPLFDPFAGEVEITWSPVERTLAAAEALREGLQRTSLEHPGDGNT
jgi:hypothetical protein